MLANKSKLNLCDKFKQSEAFRNPATVSNFIADMPGFDQTGSNDPRDCKITEYVEDLADRYNRT